uniref:AI-2E family transporter n=1 Tax=Pseudactinotalea sp. TaxID=1926260 RepID=UPI003B3B517D
GLAGLGIGPDQIEALLGGLDLPSFTSWLTRLLPSVLSAASSIVFFISMLFFMTVESTHVGMRFARLAADHPRVGAALTAFVGQTRRFYAITGAFAILVGVLDTVFLLAIGVPLALLWGVLAAVCNFIPYIGFVIGMVPPALLALLTGGWQQMLLVVIVYFVLNSLVTTLLPAKVVGDAVGLSMVVTVLSVGFWAWVLGPLGAVLAVPMTLLIKAVFVDADPRAAWLSSILTSQRELALEERARSAT